MPKNRSGRLAFALIVMIVLCLTARNLYRRYLNNALVAAVKATNVTAVRSLLDQGADPNHKIFVPSYSEDRSHPPMPLLTLAFNNRLRPSEDPYLKGFSVPNPDAETIACLLIRKGANVRLPQGQYNTYLDQACNMGDLAVMRCLLEGNIDLRTLDPRSHALDSALYYADSIGFSVPDPQLTAVQRSEVARRRAVSRQMVQLLRERGARLTLTQAYKLGDIAAFEEILHGTAPFDGDGYDVLCDAAGKGDLNLMQRLLARGVNPNKPQNPHLLPDMLPLNAAIANGNREAVSLLLAHGADPDAARQISGSALSLAANTGKLELVKLLLAHGANVNTSNSWSSTPLSSALGHPDIIRFLLAHGADPNLPRDTMYPVLAMALQFMPEVVPDLLKHGASVNPTMNMKTLHPNLDFGPFSPLGKALWYAPQYETVLLRAGARLGDPDRSRLCTVAVRTKRMDLLPKLHALGADINGMDLDGETALSQSIEHSPGSVKMLLGHGANPNVVLKSQLTPLAVAAMTGNAEVVSLLLTHGADVNVHPLRSHSALYWARKKNRSDIVSLLQHAGARE